MSLKETLGLRSHREDPKMFWFEMTLLLLILGGAAALLSLLRLQGTTGMAVRVARGTALSGAFVAGIGNVCPAISDAEPLRIRAHCGQTYRIAVVAGDLSQPSLAVCDVHLAIRNGQRAG